MFQCSLKSILDLHTCVFLLCFLFQRRRMSVRNSAVETNGWTAFDVPNQFEDLQKPLATGSYYVQNILDLADINTRLQSNMKFYLNNSLFFLIQISHEFENRKNYLICFHYSTVLLCKNLFYFYFMSKIICFPSHFDKVSITGRSQTVEILLRCKNSYF